MPKEIVLEPVEASSLFVSMVFGQPYFSEEVARRFRIPPMLSSLEEGVRFWGDIFQDTQKSQLLIESVNRVLETALLGDNYPHVAPRGIKVVKLRLGLEDGHIRTLDEAGREIGKSRERARQIEAETLMHLRHPIYAKHITPFLETK